MITLAQVSPEMLHGSVYVLCAVGALLWIYNQAREAFNREPGNEKLGEKHEALEERTSRNEGSIRRLYERTESIDKAVTRVEADTKNQNTHLLSIEAKLDRLIERRRENH